MDIRELNPLLLFFSIHSCHMQCMRSKRMRLSSYVFASMLWRNCFTIQIRWTVTVTILSASMYEYGIAVLPQYGTAPHSGNHMDRWRPSFSDTADAWPGRSKCFCCSPHYLCSWWSGEYCKPRSPWQWRQLPCIWKAYLLTVHQVLCQPAHDCDQLVRPKCLDT